MRILIKKSNIQHSNHLPNQNADNAKISDLSITLHRQKSFNCF